MCGRYTLTTLEEELAAEFELLEYEGVRPRYNIAPSQVAPVVRVLDDPGRKLHELRWGLIPSWASDPAIGNRMINARSETVASKPAFRGPLRRRRCLIPCNGFYEWKPLPARPGAKPRKQPFYIRRRDDRVFALAGLWDRWENPEGIAVDSFTILTTEPNELMRDLHNRMPVVVRRSDYALWLDPEIQDVQRLSTLFAPVPADDFSAYPVGTVVNNAAHDSPDCIRPIA